MITRTSPTTNQFFRRKDSVLLSLDDDGDEGTVWIGDDGVVTGGGAAAADDDGDWIDSTTCKDGSDDDNIGVEDDVKD